MIEKVVIEKETIYISLDTGELIDNRKLAVALYNAGHTIQIQFRHRYNNGNWSPWLDGPQWVH